jgi:GNAT superfamily N-acetyltransferase
MSTAGSRSDLVRLDAAQSRAAFASYRSAGAFFPLIGAVLEGTQDGIAYADDASQPRHVYVEHAFGFAQILGAPQPAFDAALQRYLLADRAFPAPKVRLYTPRLPDFLSGPEHAALRSERQRFKLASGAADQRGPAGRLDSIPVDATNFDAMERAFGVALRFWRTPADFITAARAVVARVDGQPAAICYAAAVSGDRAEIDVMTLPAFRQQGAGRLAVARFVERCRNEGIEPLWDCFTNNSGSMQLCRSAGFVPAAPAYLFFTITK